MLEGILTRSILHYAQQYIQHIDTNSFSLWQGEVVLQDLELRLDVLSQLLPDFLTLTSGVIKQLKITVPWKYIRSQSVEVVLDFVELVFTHDTATAEREEQSANGSISEPRPVPDSPTKKQQKEKVSWVQPLLLNIFANAVIKVNNLVVKYVHEQSQTLCALTISSIHLHPASGPKWTHQFTSLGADRVMRRHFQMLDFTLDMRSKIKRHRDAPALSRSSVDVCFEYPLTAKGEARCDIHFTPLKVRIAEPQVRCLKALLYLPSSSDVDVTTTPSDLVSQSVSTTSATVPPSDLPSSLADRRAYNLPQRPPIQDVIPISISSVSTPKTAKNLASLHNFSLPPTPTQRSVEAMSDLQSPLNVRKNTTTSISRPLPSGVPPNGGRIALNSSSELGVVDEGNGVEQQLSADMSLSGVTTKTSLTSRTWEMMKYVLLADEEDSKVQETKHQADEEKQGREAEDETQVLTWYVCAHLPLLSASTAIGLFDVTALCGSFASNFVIGDAHFSVDTINITDMSGNTIFTCGQATEQMTHPLCLCPELPPKALRSLGGIRVGAIFDSFRQEQRLSVVIPECVMHVGIPPQNYIDVLTAFVASRQTNGEEESEGDDLSKKSIAPSYLNIALNFGGLKCDIATDDGFFYLTITPGVLEMRNVKNDMKPYYTEPGQTLHIPFHRIAASSETKLAASLPELSLVGPGQRTYLRLVHADMMDNIRFHAIVLRVDDTLNQFLHIVMPASIIRGKLDIACTNLEMRRRMFGDALTAPFDQYFFHCNNFDVFFNDAMVLNLPHALAFLQYGVERDTRSTYSYFTMPDKIRAMGLSPWQPAVILDVAAKINITPAIVLFASNLVGETKQIVADEGTGTDANPSPWIHLLASHRATVRVQFDVDASIGDPTVAALGMAFRLRLEEKAGRLSSVRIGPLVCDHIEAFIAYQQHKTSVRIQSTVMKLDLTPERVGHVMAVANGFDVPASPRASMIQESTEESYMGEELVHTRLTSHAKLANASAEDMTLEAHYELHYDGLLFIDLGLAQGSFTVAASTWSKHLFSSSVLGSSTGTWELKVGRPNLTIGGNEVVLWAEAAPCPKKSFPDIFGEKESMYAWASTTSRSSWSLWDGASNSIRLSTLPISYRVRAPSVLALVDSFKKQLPLATPAADTQTHIGISAPTMSARGSSVKAATSEFRFDASLAVMSLALVAGEDELRFCVENCEVHVTSALSYAFHLTVGLLNMSQDLIRCSCVGTATSGQPDAASRHSVRLEEVALTIVDVQVVHRLYGFIPPPLEAASRDDSPPQMSSSHISPRVRPDVIAISNAPAQKHKTHATSSPHTTTTTSPAGHTEAPTPTVDRQGTQDEEWSFMLEIGVVHASLPSDTCLQAHKVEYVSGNAHGHTRVKISELQTHVGTGQQQIRATAIVVVLTDTDVFVNGATLQGTLCYHHLWDDIAWLLDFSAPVSRPDTVVSPDVDTSCVDTVHCARIVRSEQSMPARPAAETSIHDPHHASDSIGNNGPRNGMVPRRVDSPGYGDITTKHGIRITVMLDDVDLALKASATSEQMAQFEAVHMVCSVIPRTLLLPQRPYIQTPACSIEDETYCIVPWKPLSRTVVVLSVDTLSLSTTHCSAKSTTANKSPNTKSTVIAPLQCTTQITLDDARINIDAQLSAWRASFGRDFLALLLDIFVLPTTPSVPRSTPSSHTRPPCTPIAICHYVLSEASDQEELPVSLEGYIFPLRFRSAGVDCDPFEAVPVCGNNRKKRQSFISLESTESSESRTRRSHGVPPRDNFVVRLDRDAMVYAVLLEEQDDNDGRNTRWRSLVIGVDVTIDALDAASGNFVALAGPHVKADTFRLRSATPLPPNFRLVLSTRVPMSGETSVQVAAQFPLLRLSLLATHRLPLKSLPRAVLSEWTLNAQTTGQRCRIAVLCVKEGIAIGVKAALAQISTYRISQSLDLTPFLECTHLCFSCDLPVTILPRHVAPFASRSDTTRLDFAFAKAWVAPTLEGVDDFVTMVYDFKDPQAPPPTLITSNPVQINNALRFSISAGQVDANNEGSPIIEIPPYHQRPYIWRSVINSERKKLRFCIHGQWSAPIDDHLVFADCAIVRSQDDVFDVRPYCVLYNHLHFPVALSPGPFYPTPVNRMGRFSPDFIPFVRHVEQQHAHGGCNAVNGMVAPPNEDEGNISNTALLTANAPLAVPFVDGQMLTMRLPGNDAMEQWLPISSTNFTSLATFERTYILLRCRAKASCIDIALRPPLVIDNMLHGDLQITFFPVQNVVCPRGGPAVSVNVDPRFLKTLRASLKPDDNSEKCSYVSGDLFFDSLRAFAQLPGTNKVIDNDDEEDDLVAWHNQVPLHNRDSALANPVMHALITTVVCAESNIVRLVRFEPQWTIENHLPDLLLCSLQDARIVQRIPYGVTTSVWLHAFQAAPALPVSAFGSVGSMMGSDEWSDLFTATKGVITPTQMIVHEHCVALVSVLPTYRTASGDAYGGMTIVIRPACVLRNQCSSAKLLRFGASGWITVAARSECILPRTIHPIEAENDVYGVLSFGTVATSELTSQNPSAIVYIGERVEVAASVDDNHTLQLTLRPASANVTVENRTEDELFVYLGATTTPSVVIAPMANYATEYAPLQKGFPKSWWGGSSGMAADNGKDTLPADATMLISVGEHAHATSVLVPMQPRVAHRVKLGTEYIIDATFDGMCTVIIAPVDTPRHPDTDVVVVPYLRVHINARDVICPLAERFIAHVRQLDFDLALGPINRRQFDLSCTTTHILHNEPRLVALRLPPLAFHLLTDQNYRRSRSWVESVRLSVHPSHDDAIAVHVDEHVFASIARVIEFFTPAAAKCKAAAAAPSPEPSPIFIRSAVLCMLPICATIRLPRLSFTDLRINVNSWSANVVTGTMDEVIQAVLSHVVTHVLFRAPQLIGSWDLLGNPTKVMRHLQEAVRDLLSGNLSHGVRSVAHHAISASMYSVQAVSDGLRRNLPGATGNASGTGLKVGLQHLVKSVERGVDGVVRPDENIGLASRLMGVVSQPVSGVLDLVTVTARAWADVPNRPACFCETPRAPPLLSPLAVISQLARNVEASELVFWAASEYVLMEGEVEFVKVVVVLTEEMLVVVPRTENEARRGLPGPWLLETLSATQQGSVFCIAVDDCQVAQFRSDAASEILSCTNRLKSQVLRKKR
eukprot:GEMP01000111.1.p1 GENE.GEMP01000111.1~~GEMP01000111.1.p1  ORF type:complete len:3180 (+),score=692.14 GEMP01000111.1:34-9540(+)